MAVFDFDFHTVTTDYPETGDRLQLGNSYIFSSGPTAPDQRILTLHFAAMRNFVHPVTGVPDAAIQPSINFYRLELFYQEHKLFKTFDYTHVMYGLLKCKFNKPLKTPKPVEGTPGLLEGFTLEFVEIP